MICSPNEKNIAGQKFGKLTAIKRDFSKTGNEVFWLFQCDCGNIKSINKKRFSKKQTKSCGCLQKEAAKNSISKMNEFRGFEQHNKSQDKVYYVWKSMKQRCFNPNNKDYDKYGGRGITVCERWANSFDNFLADMGERPIHSTIERLDNNKGYSPDNCKWVSMIDQCNNRRTNHLVVIDGIEYKSISDAERNTGLSRMQIRHNFC